MVAGERRHRAGHSSKARFQLGLGVVLGVIAAAALSDATAGDLSSCTTTDCLLRTIPPDQEPAISMDDCAVLDGKTTSFDESLGLVCRLRVARALATSRERDPCINDDSLNPDWSMSLKEPLRLRLLNEMVATQSFKAHGITAERNGSDYNNSTINGSYVFNSFFYDNQRAAKTYVSAASYFCRSGSPEHYTPFFFVLKINDGPNANEGSSAKLQTLAMEYVETPPVERADVVNQMGDMKSSDLAAYDLGDVNGDGQPDFVLIEKRFSEPRFWLRICLFEKGSEQCEPIEANTELTSDAFSPDATVRIESGQIVTGLTDSGRVLTQRRFTVRGGKVVSVK